MKLSVEQIARTCHQANKALCESLGDFTQNEWTAAFEWQRDSAIKGVEFRLGNPLAPDSSQHDAWMKDKIEQGWVYGLVKDATAKTHPCIVPYNKLPDEQKAKYALFVAIVNALKPLL